MLSLNIAKHQAFPTHKPGEETDSEPEEDDSAELAGQGISDAGLLQNDKEEVSEAQKHIAHMLSKLASKGNMTDWLRRHDRSSTIYKVYDGQWFKPRINLCKDSFTEINSCSLETCSALTALYIAFGSCHGSGYFYGNGDMCRCYHKSYSTGQMQRYYSSSGNSIYYTMR